MRRRHTFLRCGVEAQFWCEMRIEDAIWAAEIRATLDGCCTKLGLGGSDRLSLRGPFASLLQVSRGELRVSFAANVLQSSTDACLNLRGAFKKFVACRLLTTRYAHHFSHLQLKCTWSSISLTLWYRCRRIVVPGLPGSHLPCNTNTNGKYGGWQSSSKPAFWMAACVWAVSWPMIRCVVLAPSDFCFS